MGAVEYQKISLKDIAFGIDQRSSENAISPGYSEDLLNTDTNSQGYLTKRKGYQGYYGYVPIRLTEVHQEGTKIKLCAAGDLSFLRNQSSPLVVYGMLGAPTGSTTGTDWDTTDPAHAEYYTGFSVEAQRIFPDNSTTTLMVEHSAGTPFLLTEIVQATAMGTLDNALVRANTTSVDQAGSFDVDFTLINHTAADISSFLFVEAAATVVGLSYSATFIAADWTTGQITIPAATHGLNTTDIIIQVYEDTGSAYVKAGIDNIVIKANGDVELTSTQDFNGAVVMKAVDVVQTSEVGVTAQVPMTLQVTPAAGEVFFTAVYLRDLITGDRELIEVDSTTYTEATNLLEVSLAPTMDGVLQLIYSPGTIIANCLTVDANAVASATYVDTQPQMTMWGVAHEGIYPANSTAGGHVTHIDRFRRELEERAVVGLGGTFYAARTRDEVGSTYLIPSTQVKLNERSASTKIISPFWFNTFEAPAATRVMQTDTTDGHEVPVISATWTGVAGEVVFELQLPGKIGTLADLTVHDQLTVSQMAFSKLNGTHSIVSVNDTANTITVSIPDITTADFDEVGAQGRAGVFTDSIVFQASTPFAADDLLLSNVFVGKALPVVLETVSTTVYVAGVLNEVTVPGGLLIRAQRTSDTLPVESTDYFVKGDMLAATGLARELRVTAVDTSAQTITVDETLTFADQDAQAFEVTVVGRWVPVEAPTTAADFAATTYPRYLTSNDFSEQPLIRSTMVKNTLFFTNGQDEVFKFDGSSIYRAGLQRWQPQLFIALDTTNPAIAMPGPAATVSGSSGTDFTVDSVTALTVGMAIVHDGTQELYTIISFPSDTTVRVNRTIVGAPASGALRKLRQLQYYARLDAIDANLNVVASAITGSQDYLVNLVADGQIQVRLLGLPALDAYDYDRIRIQLYRADASILDFALVGQVTIPGGVGADGYVDFVDNSDGPLALSTADTINVVLNPSTTGTQELGTRWEQPLRAKYATTLGNSLVLANIRDYAEIAVTLQQATGADATSADFNGKSLLLRKDSADTGTTSNMVDRVVYEWVDPVVAAAQVTTVSSTSWLAGVLTISLAAPVTLAAGDWIYLYHSAPGVDLSLRGAGWYQVAAAVVAGTSVTVNVSAYSALGSLTDVDSMLVASVTTRVPVLVGSDGNYNTVTGNDSTVSYEGLAIPRLANAINASMRVVDTTLAGLDEFKPWIVAGAGSDLGLGVLSLRTPRADLGPSLTLPGAIAGVEWLFNGIPQSAAATIFAQEKIFGSRVLVSFPSFSEMFDGPYGLDAQSSRVFDIDPADGQEITGLIPFFADSTFRTTQVEDMLVVFKENSIHVVQISTGDSRKLETQGIGCSAPYSVAFSNQGIIFAHRSGLYRLNKDLSISYVGKFIERLWQETLAPANDLSKATATHYHLARQYKLSLPDGHTIVYDHTREASQQVEFGAWSRYDNHPVTGWANLTTAGLFGTTNGQVFSGRRAGDATDYRDDAAAITQQITLGALDFGLPGIKKLVSNMLVQFRANDQDNSQAAMAVDLTNTFQDLDSFTLVQDTNQAGLDQQTLAKVWTLKFSLPSRRGEYFQPRFTNTGLDENMQLVGVTFNVAAVSSSTIRDAASTK